MSFALVSNTLGPIDNYPALITQKSPCRNPNGTQNVVPIYGLTIRCQGNSVREFGPFLPGAENVRVDWNCCLDSTPQQSVGLGFEARMREVPLSSRFLVGLGVSSSDDLNHFDSTPLMPSH